ncbi:MAG: hypothetical protein IJW36_02010 [Clostridia bacterium]|nr:hypothetical protein [Clostridia bacterium]
MAKKYSVLRKIGITFGIISAFASSIVLTACCGDKTQDPNQPTITPGITDQITPGDVNQNNQNNQGGAQVTPDTPDVPVTPDTPVTPDVPDAPVTPDVPDTPVTPEKTEAEYKAECIEKIKEIALTALNNNNPMLTYSNVQLKTFNASTGTIYCYAESDFYGSKATGFHIIEMDQIIADSTFESALETLENFDANSITEVETQTILEGQVSEESYNNLVDYVLEQVNLEGANVLNVTKFASVLDGSGKIHANFIVELNNIIYNVEIKGSSAESQDENIAEELLSKSSTTYEVVEEENFLSFETIGEAQEYFNSFNTANRFCQAINGVNVEFEIS